MGSHRLVYSSVRDGFLVDSQDRGAVTGGVAGHFARVKDIPPQAGARYPVADMSWWKQHVTRKFAGVTCYWQVFVIDDDGLPVFRGVRGGRGGTGGTWNWERVRTWEFAMSGDGGRTFRPVAVGLTLEDVEEHRGRVADRYPNIGRFTALTYMKLTFGETVWRWTQERD